MTNKTQQITTLQTTLQAAFEDAFGEPTLALSTGGKKFPTRPDAMTNQQIAELFRYGKRSLNDSYNSVAKIARDEGGTAPDPDAFFKTWFAGLGTNKPRGGGSSLTVEEAGRIAFYNAKASKWKIKGQTCNGKNLPEYDVRFTKAAIWDDIRDIQEEMDQDERRLFVKDELPGIIQDNIEHTLQEAMQETHAGMMGDFVEAEKRKRSGQTAPSFKAKAIIKRKPKTETE